MRWSILVSLLLAPSSLAAEPVTLDQIRDLDPIVIRDRDDLSEMVFREQQGRLRAANERENQGWYAVETWDDWEAFQRPRIEALRQSLGEFPKPSEKLKVLVTGQLEGAGYRIENLVIESRPGLVITANLYLPATPTKSMPGILLCHSHHNPKTQGELQDMGMTWARGGCVVLVPDQLGHGERRQHPFHRAEDYPESFRISRQDYHFRHNSNIQLHLIGDSLMGWMVWDLQRCIDVLLARPGIDPERVILLGAVAGGGDPAGVTAALDQRITAVVPFNFGGPQGDYRTPADPERDFYYFGVAYWESTRCLPRGARDGFAHWVIVSATAPRHLVYAHEFDWDPETDPAWPRIQQVFALAEHPERVASAEGKGSLQGQPPESSHCNNIGAYHRARIYPHFERWFDLPIPEEFSDRRDSAELICLTAEATQMLNSRPLHEVAGQIADDRLGQARSDSVSLRDRWAVILGDVESVGKPKVQARRTERVGDISVERLTLETDPGIVVPLLVLAPPGSGPKPVVVGIAHGGKAGFLRHRSEDIAALLRAGIVVCLPDLRGSGETSPGAGRDRNSAATSRSATELVLGETMIGQQLHDLRRVLDYLKEQDFIDNKQIGLWGESFAAVNAVDRRVEVPREIDDMPAMAEPMGGTLALLGALFDEEVRAVHVQGGLIGYRSVLDSPFLYVPHDAIVPGSLAAGDLCDVAAAVAPRPVRLTALVNGVNRRAGMDAVLEAYAATRAAYQEAGNPHNFQVSESAEGVAAWMAEQFR